MTRAAATSLKRRKKMIEIEKDYLMQVKIKNLPMLKMMKKHKFFSAAELSRASKVGQTAIGKYLNLSKSPFSKYGRLYKDIEKICAALNCLPEQIFPQQHMINPLEKNTAEIELSIDEIQNFIAPSTQSPQLLIERQEIKSILETMIKEVLTPREQEVIIKRFYEDKTLEQVGIEMCNKGTKKTGLSQERIRQIEAKALRKLKHQRNRVRLENIMYNGKEVDFLEQ